MEKAKHVRRFRGKKQIADILARYGRSGKNMREFCDLEGISYSSLGNWLRAGKQGKGRAGKKPSPAFVSLKLRERQTAGDVFMQIRFPDGRTVSFFAEPAAELVKTLLS